MAQTGQVLWDVSDNVLVYVLPVDDDQVIKEIVRFGKNHYESIAVGGIALVFKVRPIDIESDLISGTYQ